MQQPVLRMRLFDLDALRQHEPALELARGDAPMEEDPPSASSLWRPRTINCRSSTEIARSSRESPTTAREMRNRFLSVRSIL